MVKTLILEPILYTPPPPSSYFWVLPLLVVRHSSRLSSYAISNNTNKTSENSEKPNFGPDFGPYGPNLDIPFFFVEFTSASI